MRAWSFYARLMLRPFGVQECYSVSGCLMIDFFSTSSKSLQLFQTRGGAFDECRVAPENMYSWTHTCL